MWHFMDNLLPTSTRSFAIPSFTDQEADGQKKKNGGSGTGGGGEDNGTGD
jgi:hypothetical protein